MKIRKPRNYSFGRTNNDFRSIRQKNKRFSSNMGMTRQKYLSLPRNSQEFKNMFQSQSMRKTAPQPFRKTQDFYQTQKKLWKTRVSLDQPKPYLKDEHLLRRKNVFQGDSKLNFDKNPIWKSRMSKTEVMRYINEGTMPDNSRVPLPWKRQLNQEMTSTDPANVRMSQNLGFTAMGNFKKKSSLQIDDSLAGKVDVNKIRKIRQSIRKRYANRRKINKIFSTWDRENKGYVNASDVYTMCNDLGHDINLDEAKVLLTSADNNNNQKLNLDEFLVMIYNVKDTPLNVDLSTLRKSQMNYKKGDFVTLKKLRETQQIQQRNQHQNQISCILQRRTKELQKSFLGNDFSKKGFVNFQQFENALKKLCVSEKIIGIRDIKKMFNKHKIDSHKVDYNNFLKDLNSFQLQTTHLVDGDRKPSKKGKIDILDPQVQPINRLENIYKNGQRVTRAIQRYFPKQKDFETYISDTLEKQIGDNQIHSEEFHSVLKNIFKQFNDDLKYEDIQGFLSKFKYNKHGYTNGDQVGAIVYKEDQEDFLRRVTNLTHGPPPDEIVRSKRIKSSPYETDNLMKVQRPLARDDDSDAQVLKQAIEKFDNAIFRGNGSLQVYRSFDADQDGYVSHNDIKKRIQSKNLLTKRETELLISYADAEDKGYLTFKDFSKILRPNMSNLRRTGGLKDVPYHQNNKMISTRFLKNRKGIQKRVKEIKTPFIPDNYTKLMGKTRFGGNPEWQNTFYNIQPPTSSAMYQSEYNRFKGGRLRKTMFQIENKEKRKFKEQARRAQYAKQRIRIDNILQTKQDQQDIKTINKLQSKQGRQLLYEHNCRLRNEYK